LAGDAVIFRQHQKHEFMLDSLRSLASGWIAQLLLAILVISFAVWGVADIFTGFGGNAVARVGNADITVAQFQRAYQAATQNVAQQLGQNITPDQLVQLGLPGQVLNQLVVEASFDDAAQRMGLGLSDDELGKQIAADPNFRAPTGQFDKQYLAQIIASQQMTQDEFILDRRAAYTRAQLIEAFGSGNATPDAYMQAVHEYRDNQRAISYVVVNAPAADTIAEPSDADLNTYFTAHKAAYTAPEYRAVNFFVLSPDQLADPTQVTDEDAKARYDSQPDLYTIPSQRQVEQIVFKDQADAEAGQKELADGKSFEDLAMERGLMPSDYDLGFITKDKIIDPAVADAAFSIPENSVSQIVMGQFGPVIVKVKGVQDQINISFDDSKQDIKQQIALERASADIINIHDQIEDARAGGASLTDAAAKFGLKMTTVPALDSSGNDAMGNPVPNLPVAVLTGAFMTTVGTQNDPVQPDQNSYAWYEVTGITPPHDRTLADVRDKVVADWKDGQRQIGLDAATTAIKTRLDGGQTLDAIAADQMLTVEKSDMITRLTQPSGDLSMAALAATFSVDKGGSAVAPGVNPLSSIVFTVDDVNDPPFNAADPSLANVKTQLNSQIITDLLSTYAAQLQSQTEVHVNQAALTAVLGVAPSQ
jgi:peptidyl-prolyl cis-trans isomerase D